MCQISVVVEKEGKREKVMDNVTALRVTEAGIVLSTFFEEPKTLEAVAISSIDFLEGTVVLVPNGGDRNMRGGKSDE